MVLLGLGDGSVGTEKIKIKEIKMEEFYTIKEVANKLKVHWKTIYRWIQEDKIKATKFGRDWKISQEEIDFIKNNGLRN